MASPRVLTMLATALALPACTVEVDVNGDGARARNATEQAIVGSVVDTGDPAVVEVLVDGSGECTGTLIAPRVVLTAAHCITEGVPAGALFGVFLGVDDSQPGESVAATAFPHAGYVGDTSDIAVLVLDEPLDIAPLPYLHAPLSTELIGDDVRIVGYGDNTVADPTEGFGVKRQATTSLNDFDDEWVYVGDAEHNQCFGDSGGPALMLIDGVETIVGVDSWSDSDNCDVENANTNVNTYASFIDGQVAAADDALDGGDGDGDGDGDASPDDVVGFGCASTRGDAGAFAPFALFALLALSLTLVAMGRVPPRAAARARRRHRRDFVLQRGHDFPAHGASVRVWPSASRRS